MEVKAAASVVCVRVCVCVCVCVCVFPRVGFYFLITLAEQISHHDVLVRFRCMCANRDVGGEKYKFALNMYRELHLCRNMNYTSLSFMEWVPPAVCSTWRRFCFDPNLFCFFLFTHKMTNDSQSIPDPPQPRAQTESSRFLCTNRWLKCTCSHSSWLSVLHVVFPHLNFNKLLPCAGWRGVWGGGGSAVLCAVSAKWTFPTEASSLQGHPLCTCWCVLRLQTCVFVPIQQPRLIPPPTPLPSCQLIIAPRYRLHQKVTRGGKENRGRSSSLFF